MKLYFRGFIFLIGLIWHCKAQCPTPTATAGITVEEIVQGELAVHTCPDGEEFTTGDKALVTQCEGTTWETFSATCQAMSDPNLVCDVDLTIPDTTLDDVYSNSKYKVFECIDDLVWLSGQKKQVSQCKYGEWTPVLDVCDSVCDIPRECSGVASLGFNESGWFNVIPSGNLNDPAKLVFCEIDASADPMRQNWTLVLVSKDTDTMTKPSEQYINGFGDDTVATSETLIEYFIGLESLAGWGNSENPLPMVLEIEFQKEISGETHSMYATYSNFQVGEGPNYRLNSIGDYHGDAGDGLCCHVEMDFMVGAIDANTQGNFWWGNPGGVTTAGQADYDTFMERIKDQKGSYLTATGTPNWYPLVKPNVDPNVEDYFFAYTSVTMRVRPVHIENTTFCPPRHGSEPYWERTIVDFKDRSQYYRSTGHVIHYWCKGDLQREGLEGGPRSVEGTITCEGDPPRWSPDVYLPCTLDCPDGYNISSDGETCYRFSKDDAKDLVDAAQKCLKEKASMAYFHNADDYQIAEAGVKYMTGYTARTTTPKFQGPEGLLDPATIIYPPPLTTFEAPTSITDCVILDVVAGEGVYEYTDCEAPSTSKYVCQRPGLCPTGFHYVMGGCYKESSADFPTFLDAYKDCLNDGAGLAYPTTDDQVADIFGAANFTLAYGTPFYLGLNDAKGTGDWSLNNVYNITFDISEINKTIPGRWLMSQHIDPTFTNDTEVITWLEPSAIDPIDPSAKGLCQLHAPAHCAPYNTTNGPPLPLSNMYAHGDSISSPDTHIHVNDATDITYTCYSGYFVNANTSLTIQTAKCLGQLGGWITVEHTTLQPCELFPVCENMTSSAPLYTHLMDIITYDNSSYLNGSVYYECPINMTTESGDTLQTTTCVSDNADPPVYKYDPDILQECKVCVEEPIFINATTTFATNGQVLIDSSVTATCITDYEFGFLEDGISVVTQDVLCTAYSWNWTDVNTICQPACTIHPPLAGDNMIRDNITSRVVGTQVNYTCAESYNIRPTQNFSRRDANETFVTCTEPRTWDLERVNEALQCVKVCQADPPEAPLNSTRTWDGFSRAENDSITYTCDNTFLFPNYSQVVVIHCNGTHWEEIPTEEFVCNQACTLSIEREHGGGLVDWYDSEDALYIPAWPGEAANYSCPERQATKNGTYNTTIHCQKDGNWSVADSTFQCFNACDGAPPLPPLFSSYNFSEAYPDFTDGVVITYVCPGYFATGNLTLDNICQDFNWTLLEIPDCNPITTIGPTAAVVLPTIPPFDDSYEATSDYYWGTMKDELKCSEGTKCFKEIEGPFGFGSGIQLDGTQCMKKESYQYGDESCTQDLENCPNGLSFSVWAKKPFGGKEMFDVDMEELIANDTMNEYLFSTGGDKNGSPGVSIYVKGLIIGAVVCKKDKLWKIDVINPKKVNGTWYNVGVRWKEEISVINGEKLGGLELFLDLNKIGQVMNPEIITTRLPALDPPEVMIGCHKTQNDTTYRGYSKAQFDEAAMWTRQLLNNETLLFLGGYKAEAAELTPAKIKDLLNDVDTSDPNQLATYLSYLEKMEEGTETAPTTQPTPIDGQNPQTTAASRVTNPAVMTTPNPEEFNNFRDYVDIVKGLTSVSRVAPELEVQGFKVMTGILGTASKILKEENKGKWDQLHRNADDSGAAGVLDNLIDYYSKALHNTKFDNTTEDIYYSKVYPNIIFQSRKYEIETFQKKTTLVSPAINSPLDPELRDTDVQDKWNLPHDRIEIPTGIFSDDRCLTRAVSTTSFMFNAYGKYATTRVNPVLLSTETHKSIDSKAAYVGVTVDPVYKGSEIDPHAPPCQPDKMYLQKNPLSYKLSHIERMPSLYHLKNQQRKLMFHENEEYTEITRRHCVRWNRDISDFGAWDPNGCNMIESNEKFTVCNCDGFGLFAVLAEKTDPIVIPAEMFWLKLAKYILYSISALLLVFYIALVLAASDLRDQLHLMGMNLSIAVLLGSASMCLSDIESIRSDRHLNVILGTLIHYFYAAEGVWLALIGMASFKAITEGIIGGKFKSYCMIGWGIPLALIGFPFAMYLHDLGRDPRCFISWENKVKYLFFGPHGFFCFFATFFGFIVFANLSTTALRKDNLELDYSTFSRGAAFMSLYISLTWIFGFFTYIRFDDSTTDYTPLFQLLNSITGIFIFLLMGIASNRFRIVLAGKTKARREKIFNMAIKGIFAKKEDEKILENEHNEFDIKSSDTSKYTSGPRARSGQVSGRSVSAKSARPQTS